MPHRFAIVVEQGFQLAGLRDVERRRDLGAELDGERLDMGTRLVVQPGEGEIGARRAKRLRAAIGDRLVVGDADDQRLAAGENGRDFLLHVDLTGSVS